MTRSGLWRATLLNDPQLLPGGPTTPPAGIDDLEATDVMTVGTDIQTHSQLRSRSARKAAHAGCLLRKSTRAI
jgi:hypothetical protein